MIDKLIQPVSDILDKFVVDKDLKTKLSHELQKELISLDKAQIAKQILKKPKTGTGLYQEQGHQFYGFAHLVWLYIIVYCLSQLG